MLVIIFHNAHVEVIFVSPKLRRSNTTSRIDHQGSNVELKLITISFHSAENEIQKQNIQYHNAIKTGARSPGVAAITDVYISHNADRAYLTLVEDIAKSSPS